MSTEKPDLYAVLGVPPTATQAEIGHAYRALLHRNHPDTRVPAGPPHDVQSDAELQQVLAAYTVLRDPARRADYNRSATPDPAPAATRTPPRVRQHHRPDSRPPIVAGPVRWRPVS